MRVALLVLFLASAASAQPAVVPPPAAEPRAVATVARSEVTIGEAFEIEVRASGPAGTVFTFPREATGESFEVRVAPGDTASTAGDTQRYQAMVFALGETQVPPIGVQYRLADGTTGEAKTEPIPITVGSLLPKAQDEQKLADIRGPVGMGVGRAFWIGLAALLVLLGALAYWLVSRRRRAPAALATSVPTLEPDQDARRALDALVATGLLARGEFRRFYIELTVIAKRYMERRLGAPILEMTTVETLAHLRSHPHGVGLAPTLRDLTAAADQIKFARGRGMHEEAERHLTATRALVDDLETRLRPASAPSGEAA